MRHRNNELVFGLALKSRSRGTPLVLCHCSRMNKPTIFVIVSRSLLIAGDFHIRTNATTLGLCPFCFCPCLPSFFSRPPSPESLPFLTFPSSSSPFLYVQLMVLRGARFIAFKQVCFSCITYTIFFLQFEPLNCNRIKSSK